MAAAPLLSAPLLLSPEPSTVRTLSFQVKDTVDLIVQTIAKKNLFICDEDNNPISLENFEVCLYENAQKLMGGPLSDEMKQFEESIFQNQTGLTPNQAAIRYTTKTIQSPQREALFYNTPFFDPLAVTLRCYRAALGILRFGTDPSKAAIYLNKFADEALYITSGTSELMVGKEDIRKGNEKNMAFAPELTYDVLYLMANRNSIRFGLTNNLKNGKKFDLSSINFVNPKDRLSVEKDHFTLNMDNYKRGNSIKKILLFMLFHPIVTVQKLLGYGPSPVSSFPGPDLDPAVEPIALVMDAYKLALKTLGERNFTVLDKGQLVDPLALLNRIDQIAEELSGGIMPPDQKILLSRIQTNLAMCTANKIVKDSAGIDLGVAYGNSHLLNSSADSFITKGFAQKFLYNFSNLENKDQFADLFADESIYLESGVTAVAGKEAIGEKLKYDYLRSTPAIVTVDEEAYAQNNFVICSQTYYKEGKITKVCLEMFFDNEGKVIFLKEISP